MRRRIGYLLLIGAVAAIGWTAAPALSLDPYMPAAEDFQQPLPEVSRVTGLRAEGLLGGDGHDHGGEGPITHWTEVIEAPKRFDLVGLAGELRAAELRARPRGGEWSRWTETADGNPVYFGGADEVQLRTRGWRPTGRLHYVNVSGTATPASAFVSGARKAVNGALISAAAIVQPAAGASPPRPDFITRGDWGANRASGGCRPRTSPSYGSVRAGVVHHTVTANEYTRAQAPGIVLGICRFHRNANGWNDIGYNALTDRFGQTYVGRAGGIGRAVVGAHAQGFNGQTTGMAVLGTHTDRPIGEQAQRAFGRFFAWKLRRGVPIDGRVQLRSLGGSSSRYPAGRVVDVNRVIAHRRLNHTACPGNVGHTQVRAIRELAHRIRTEHERAEEPAETTSLPTRLEIDRARLRDGRLVVRGSLDPAAAGQAVEVRFRAAGAQTVLRPTVGPGGEFGVNEDLRGPQQGVAAGRVVVRFSGNATLRAVSQRVRAARRAVRLRFPHARIEGGRLVARGRVAPRAGRQVRFQIRFNRLDGSPAQIAVQVEVNPRGRFRLRRSVPPAVRSHGAWVSATHPGRAQLHGQRFGREVGG